MWKFKPFTQKEPASLEGRAIDIGKLKIYVRHAIAEGGFSCVYLARDAAHASKQYALKHVICNDGESLDLVMKEIQVMKLLSGHPNIVPLIAHTILDMGRTKEALLVMEFCDRSLVSVLENRGAGYFEEKQVLLIFRDVCNAVFAMHHYSPPIAHRDLKAENVLLGSDRGWKLCDFGSISTNHKCFDKAEEMGIEEDNIRKHTTPAYRAPEMWDLYRKEVINEKVDIWALGCLLYRICYLKSAFDGESKLQILNGNYRIPDLPKYSASITRLIKDMLEASPNARPDITQVWFRVNELLPLELQKNLPDGPASAVNLQAYSAKLRDEGASKKSNLTPQRNPPPSSTEQVPRISPQSRGSQKTDGGGAGPVGAFWSTHHAQDNNTVSLGNRASIQNSSTGLNSGNTNSSTLGKEQEEVELSRLKEQLKQSNSEKAEVTAKFEKLTAICHSQQQEIQMLKRALAEATSSPQISKDSSRSQITPGSTVATPSTEANKDSSKSQISPGGTQSVTPQREKIEKGIWELEQAMFANSSTLQSPEPQQSASEQWQAFAEEPKVQPASTSVLSTPANYPVSMTTFQGNPPQRFGGSNTKEVDTSKPLGWAAF